MVLIQLALLESMSPHKSSIAAQLSVTGLFIFAMILPSFTAAQSTADLQAQIQALMAQIAAMQGSLGQTQSTSPVYEGESDDYGRDTTSEDYCPTLTVTLQYGSRDARTQGQVTDLQIYLANYFDVSEEGLVSGFFGKNTERYVKKFQQQNNLPAFGIAGSQTRAKIASMCGGVTPRPNAVFSASPTNGTAPLSVTFNVQGGRTSYFGGTKIEFGDGQTGGVCVPGMCGPIQTSYVYQAPGTYTARLIGIGEGSSTIIGTATITVGDDKTVNEQCTGFTFTTNYRMHDIGGEVSEINKFLNVDSTGYNVNTFSVRTFNAVDAFQRKYNLGDANAGVWDAMTRAKANAISAQCQPTQSITVTAPNGGEQWEKGVLNSITWKPYGYNPDVNPSRIIDAFLERRNSDGSFTTLGSVIPSGKASIHWMTGFFEQYSAPYKSGFAEPGQYYIRIINKETGAWDRSDAPFTVTPPLLSLKVNGSEGLVTVSNGETVALTWSVTRGLTDCRVSGTFDGGYAKNVANSGSMNVRIDTEGVGPTTFVHLACTQAPIVYAPYDPNPIDTTRNGKHVVSAQVNLSVRGTPQPAASLQITSPNGGEQIDPSKEMVITFSSKGLKSASVALYKNEQWKHWIDKDVQPSAKDLDFVSVNWIPSQSLEGLGEADNAGARFKIYVTGQKADGSGYIDDKSDAPFSFTSSEVSNLATYRAYIGGSSYPNITSQNATEAYALENCKLNALSNPSKSIRCTWGEKEIYNSQTSQASLRVTAGTQPVNTLAPQAALVPTTRFVLTNTGSATVQLGSLSFAFEGNTNTKNAIHHIGIMEDGGKEAVSANMPFANGSTAHVSAPFALAPGQSKTYTASMAMLANLSSFAGTSASLALVGVGTSANVTGSLPIAGAVQTINTTLDACANEQLYGYSCWASPVAPSCTTPWGASVAHGSSITAYQNSSVPSGTSCESIAQARTCTKGDLSGSYAYASCAAKAPASAHVPRGYVDAVNCQEISGWAQDEDVPDSAIDVHIYIDKPPTVIDMSGFSGHMTANQNRGDLCATIGSCNHGYSYPTPAKFVDGNEHTAYVYAIDPAVNNNPLLPSSGTSLKFTCSNATALNDRVSNLASALTALESGLQRLLGWLNR